MFSTNYIGALLAAALALSVASYGLGRLHQKTSDTRHATESQLEAYRRADALARELALKETALQDLRAELEEAADADPLADRPALGADSVRRLNRVGAH